MKHRPVALLDACVLVPMPLADTPLRLAEPPAVFEPRWSEQAQALGHSVLLPGLLVKIHGKEPACLVAK